MEEFEKDGFAVLVDDCTFVDEVALGILLFLDDPSMLLEDNFDKMDCLDEESFADSPSEDFFSSLLEDEISVFPFDSAAKSAPSS